MTASKSDVAGMKAMLTGVFAKAAEAKGKAGRGPTTAPAPKTPAAPGRDPTVRLSLGTKAAEDALGRPSEPAVVVLADRLEPAIRALARDLGRLLIAFGMEESGAAAAETALVGRFGDAERRAAVAALDGPAGELRPLAGDARQDVAVELSGISLVLAAGQVDVRLDNAALTLARVPEMLEFYGPDVMLLIGGDLLSAGSRMTQEAAKFQEAVLN